MECFKLFDTQNNGSVTLSDLREGMRNLLSYEYKGHEETYLMFKRFDKD